MSLSKFRACPDYAISNVVTVATFLQEGKGDLRTINLTDLVNKNQIGHHDPIRFSPVIVRIHEPKATALIFRKCVGVITGAESEKHTLLAANLFAMLLQRCTGRKFRPCDLRTENIVATINCGFSINLELLAETLNGTNGCTVEYGSNFPGAFLRRVVSSTNSRKNSITHLIFVTGKIITTGSRTESQVVGDRVVNPIRERVEWVYYNVAWPFRQDGDAVDSAKFRRRIETQRRASLMPELRRMHQFSPMGKHDKVCHEPMDIQMDMETEEKEDEENKELIPNEFLDEEVMEAIAEAFAS